ncbi:MAG: DUF2029 domain-containing protein [Bifidobacteriaceae bacterium]|jgi:hypothetical protein|nr:DUF2029 domain-containing protein [Bifidobacteriaceae bacterium]
MEAQLGKAKAAALLIGAFAIVHGWLFFASFKIEAVGATDVGLYDYWMNVTRDQGVWPVLDYQWVYPILALVPMVVADLAAGLFPPEAGWGYMASWCLMVTVINAAVACFVWWAVGPRRAVVAVGFWLALLASLGTVGITRIDAVATPLIIVALVSAARRPRVAMVLLTIGAWIKVAPGSVALPLFALVRRRAQSVLAPGAAVCAVVGLGAWLLGASRRDFLAFVTEQGSRGLQIESVAATPIVVVKALRGEQTWEYNDALGTVETVGGLADAFAAMTTWLLPLAAVAIGLAAFRARHRAGEALTVGAMAILSAMIVTNKVGSPQFIAWLAPPVVAALARRPRSEEWRAVAVAMLVIGGLTQLIYPIGYFAFLENSMPMVTVVAVRNLGVVGLLVWSSARLWQLGRPEQDAKPARPARDIDADGGAAAWRLAYLLRLLPGRRQNVEERDWRRGPEPETATVPGQASELVGTAHGARAGFAPPDTSPARALPISVNEQAAPEVPGNM